MERFDENKKANIGVQTYFMILMAVLLVAIVLFGYNKLAKTNEIISDSELIEIKEDIKSAVEFCEDPLNSGDVKSLRISHPSFNGICIIDESIIDGFDLPLRDELEVLYNLNKNVILLRDNLTVVDSFEVNSQFVGCFYVENGKGIEVKIEC